LASKSLAPGTILITATEAGTGAAAVFRLTAAKGTATKVSSGGDFTTPIGIAVDGKGAIVVADADAFGGQGGVIRIDPETGEQKMLSTAQEPAGSPALREIGIALEANGSIIVVEQSLGGGMHQANGRVTRINPKTGARKVVCTGGVFASPAGVAIEADGNILVADTAAFGGSGGVVRIDPKKGKQTKVSSAGVFVSPIAVAVEADGTILVADADAFATKGGVIRVDPSTGAQKKLASGGKFTGPRGAAVVFAPT
jgi:DNA-binding beta-propeller fold protein YncE